MFPREASIERQLRAPWAAVLGMGWVSIGVALVAVGVGSRRIGKPVWWLGDAVPVSPSPLWIIPLIAPLAAVIASRSTAASALATSAAACAALAGVAVGDLGTSRAAALVELVLAAAGVLLTTAASAGVPTRRRPKAPR